MMLRTVKVLLLVGLLFPCTSEGKPYNTPAVDGVLSVSADDWDADDLAAFNNDVPSLEIGDLDSLWVTWDRDSLYIGVKGIAFSATHVGRFSFALDVDLGADPVTGRNDFRDRFTVGPLVAMEWVIEAAGFGADYVGMARAVDTRLTLSRTPETAPASSVSDASYRQAVGSRVSADSLQVIEVAVPWTLLYPDQGGGVKTGATIALTAALLINQSRPPQKLTDDVIPSKTLQGSEYAFDSATWTLTTDYVVAFSVDADADGVPDETRGEGSISGSLTFDDFSGAPYPAVQIAAYDAANPDLVFRKVLSDTSDGTFSMSELGAGRSYNLEFSHPWYEPLSLDEILVPSGAPAVDLGLRSLSSYTGSISGTVLPGIVRARVVASRDGAAIDSATTNGTSGVFRIGHLGTGTYALEARAVGLETCYLAVVVDTVEVVNGQDTSVGQLELTALGSISGSISPDTLEVTVEAWQDDLLVLQVEAEGSYRLTCLEEGFYTVEVTPQDPGFAGGSLDSIQVIFGEETSDIDFTLVGISTWRFARDPVGDDHGPSQMEAPSGDIVYREWYWPGHYVYEDGSRLPDGVVARLFPVDGLYYDYPTSNAIQPESHDLRSVEIKGREEETMIEFVVTVGSLPDPENPPPDYDYVEQGWTASPFVEEDAQILLQMIDIYIDADPGGSIRGLPWRAHDIAEWDAWEYAIVANGWWKGVILSNGSSLRENYSVFRRDADLDIHVNFSAKSISIKVRKSLLGNPTREDVEKWDVLVVLDGHDSGDDTQDLGVVRWVEASTQEWRFGGGRSGSPGTWDGKQDPNAVDVLPLPGVGHELPDVYCGQMMDYTLPENRERIETDEYPVRLAASRFEDREAPEVDFDQNHAFVSESWMLNGYDEQPNSVDGLGEEAYGDQALAITTGAAGSAFERSIDIGRQGWYEVRVRSIAYGQTMRLLVNPDSLFSADRVETLQVQLPSTQRWTDEVWGTVHLVRGSNYFRFEMVSGSQDVTDGMTLVPTVPDFALEDMPLDLQIAQLANTDYITVRTGVTDNMGAAFEDYINAWMVYKSAGQDTMRVVLGQEDDVLAEWLVDARVEAPDTLVFFFEVKDNAALRNPEPKEDNWSRYPRMRPDQALDPLDPPVGPDSLLTYRIPVVSLDHYEAAMEQWLGGEMRFLSPEGSKVVIPQASAPDGVEALKVALRVPGAAEIPSTALAPNSGNLRSVGAVRDVYVYDMTGVTNPDSAGPRLNDFDGPVEISVHYSLSDELEGRINEDNLVLYRWEPLASRWVFVGGRVNVQARTVLTRVEHLAERYGVFEDRGLSRDRDDFVTEIAFAPNPFSPNGDGIYDEIRISYHLWENALITIDIYDMSGHEVNNFVYEEVNPEGRALGYDWDGRDKNGQLVPYGIYIIRFRAQAENEYLYRFNKAIAVIR